LLLEEPKELVVLKVLVIATAAVAVVAAALAQEAKELQDQGYEPVLKHTRWCLLKRPENLTGKQDLKLRELVKYNLKTVRAFLLKEDLQLHSWSERWIAAWK
jgi:transposase